MNSAIATSSLQWVELGGAILQINTLKVQLTDKNFLSSDYHIPDPPKFGLLYSKNPFEKLYIKNQTSRVIRKK